MGEVKTGSNIPSLEGRGTALAVEGCLRECREAAVKLRFQSIFLFAITLSPISSQLAFSALHIPPRRGGTKRKDCGLRPGICPADKAMRGRPLLYRFQQSILRLCRAPSLRGCMIVISLTFSSIKIRMLDYPQYTRDPSLVTKHSHARLNDGLGKLFYFFPNFYRSNHEPCKN